MYVSANSLQSELLNKAVKACMGDNKLWMSKFCPLANLLSDLFLLSRSDVVSRNIESVSAVE